LSRPHSLPRIFGATLDPLSVWALSHKSGVATLGWTDWRDHDLRPDGQAAGERRHQHPSWRWGIGHQAQTLNGAPTSVGALFYFSPSFSYLQTHKFDETRNILYGAWVAEIAIYQCDNQRCAQPLRLGRGFPVWKEETPKALRTPVPSPEAAVFVTRFRSESFCTPCNKVVEIRDASCEHCGGAVLLEHTATTCPRCSDGSLSLTRLTVY
jgi:hypothetical protein